jgi:hypothetical protein
MMDSVYEKSINHLFNPFYNSRIVNEVNEVNEVNIMNALCGNRPRAREKRRVVPEQAMSPAAPGALSNM